MTDPRHAQQHDLGEAVQLDNAETLAGPPNDDPLDSGWVPPDRPVALDRTGVTAREQREGGSLEERLREEEPEERLREEDSEEWQGGDDLEESLPGDDAEEADLEPHQRAGRLVAPDEGAHADEEPDLVASDVGVDGGAASAEEAAMHIEPER